MRGQPCGRVKKEGRSYSTVLKNECLKSCKACFQGHDYDKGLERSNVWMFLLWCYGHYLLLNSFPHATHCVSLFAQTLLLPMPNASQNIALNSTIVQCNTLQCENGFLMEQLLWCHCSEQSPINRNKHTALGVGDTGRNKVYQRYHNVNKIFLGCSK